jgi:ATP-dependent Clp protease adaptor protein ClpS
MYRKATSPANPTPPQLHLKPLHARIHSVANGMPVMEPVIEELVRLAPRWNVVLLNDDDHSYEYVIEMLQQVFAHSLQTAFAMAVEVDSTGRVIVDTTSRERAELKQEQIHSFGPDWRIPRCQGAMSAEIEPAVD